MPNNVNDYVITYDLSDQSLSKRLRKVICSIGPGYWVQRSVRRVSSPLDGPTIMNLVQEASKGSADVLVVEVLSVQEHHQ